MSTWLPYDFEPVVYPDTDMILTYRIAAGSMDSMSLRIGSAEYPFDVGDSGAEVIVPYGNLANVPDQTLVEVRAVTGGKEYTVQRGFTVRAG